MAFNETWDNNSSSSNFSDSYNNSLENEPGYPHSMAVLYTLTEILYGVVCVVGLCGNTLVIYVVLRYSKMQTVTNLYILNLAVADEFFLIGIPFLLTTMSLESWPFGNVMCKVFMTTTSINQFTSSIFLTVMSADRYVAVCHPISSPKFRTPFISKVVSLTAWLASALLIVPIYMYSTIITLPVQGHNHSSCNIYWPKSNLMNSQTAFTLYSFILGFAIPLVLISVFYILVIRKLQTVGPKHRSREKKKSHRKVTKLVLTVITVYVLCWLPYWILQVALIFMQPKVSHSSIWVTVFLLAGCLSYSNSAMNPILYAFLSDNFKKSFLKACTCAAGKDVNAALHLENSVFPRRARPGSERARPARERESEEEGAGRDSTEPSTGVTLTSRSTTDKEGCRNGLRGADACNQQQQQQQQQQQSTQV